MVDVQCFTFIISLIIFCLFPSFMFVHVQLFSHNLVTVSLISPIFQNACLMPKVVKMAGMVASISLFTGAVGLKEKLNKN